MSRPAVVLGVAMLSLAGAFVSAGEARAGCAWRVGGQIGVHDQVTSAEAGGTWRALEGVEVKVSGSLLNSGGFASWGKVVTDHEGRFELTRSKNCWKRRIRVQVRLNSADLKVINGEGGEWYTVFEHGSKQSHRAMFDVGTRTFTDDHGSSTLRHSGNYRRAITWYMVHGLMNRLEDVDPWLGLRHKIYVKYPANSISGVSYASAFTTYIHADRDGDSWDPETLFHEVMHLWIYQHHSGITNWLGAVLWDFTTHGEQENPNIAFHEGYAEYAAIEALADLWPERFSQKRWFRWAWDRFDTLDQVQRSDWGVTMALRYLSREHRAVDWLDTLRVFRASTLRGWPRNLELGRKTNGLLMYLERAADLLGGFSHTERAQMLATITPR